MSFPGRTHLQHVLLIVFAAGLAPCAAAAMQPATAPSVSATRSSGVVQSSSAVSTMPPGPATPRRSSMKLYDLLLSEAGGDSVTLPVLVVPSKPVDSQVVAQAVEDLSVMSRIIEKNAFGEYHDSGGVGDMAAYNPYGMSAWTGSGPATVFASVGRAKPMYLGGYGAVFFVQVNYPLLPPPETPKEQPADSKEDPTWAEARRSVFEPQARPVVPQEEAEPVEPYSGERMDTLKSELMTTLKHATNIRVLEPAEWVTIVVQGVTPAPPVPAGPPSAPTALPAATPAAGRTVLTLRATKADVDQYARGQLDQQQFTQRVQIVTY